MFYSEFNSWFLIILQVYVTIEFHIIVVMNYADRIMKSSRLKIWAVGFAVGNEGKATLEG